MWGVIKNHGPKMHLMHQDCTSDQPVMPNGRYPRHVRHVGLDLTDLLMEDTKGTENMNSQISQTTGADVWICSLLSPCLCGEFLHAFLGFRLRTAFEASPDLFGYLRGSSSTNHLAHDGSHP
jgi:hypothetical protein